LHLVQVADQTPAAQGWDAHARGGAGGEFAALLDLWLAALSAAEKGASQGVVRRGRSEAAEGGSGPGVATEACWPVRLQEGRGGLSREHLNPRTCTMDPWVVTGGAPWVWPFNGGAADPSPGGGEPVSRAGGSAPECDDPFPETDGGPLECLVRPAHEALLAAAATPPCVVVPVAGPKVAGVEAAAGFQASQPPSGPFAAVPAVEGRAEDPGPAPGNGSRGTVVAGRPAERSEGVPVDGVRGAQALPGTGGRPEATGQPEGQPGTVPSAGASATEDLAAWGPGHVREGTVPAGTTSSAPVGRTGGPYEGPVAVSTVAGSTVEDRAAPKPEGKEMWRRPPEGRGNPERASVPAADPLGLGPQGGSASARPGRLAPPVAPADAGNRSHTPAPVLTPGEGRDAGAGFRAVGEAPPAEGGKTVLKGEQGHTGCVGCRPASPAEGGELAVRAALAPGDAMVGTPGEGTPGPQTVPRVHDSGSRYAPGPGEGADAAAAGTPEGGDAAGAATQAEGRQRDGGSGAVPGWRGTAFEPPGARETPARGTDRTPTGTVAPREAEAGTAVAALRVMHEGHHPPQAERVPPGLVPERVLAAVRHLAKTGEGQVRLELELDPPGLGRLVVRLAWDDGVLRADFLVASHQARQAVEAFLPRLRENLAGLVTLAETGVWVYPDTTASGWWQPARHHQEPLPAAAVPVPEREAEPVFRGRPHGGVLDCLI